MTAREKISAREAAVTAVFPTPLRVEMMSKWDNNTSTARAKLLKEFWYWSSGLRCWLKVPDGFETDFASVPYAARWYVDVVDPDILFPAIVHDYLYQIRGDIVRRTLTRKQADDVLREAMLAIKAPTLKTSIVYRAVRLGGGKAWST